VMIEFGASKMIYATGYKRTVAASVDLLLNAVQEFELSQREDK